MQQWASHAAPRLNVTQERPQTSTQRCSLAAEQQLHAEEHHGAYTLVPWP